MEVLDLQWAKFFLLKHGHMQAKFENLCVLGKLFTQSLAHQEKNIFCWFLVNEQ